MMKSLIVIICFYSLPLLAAHNPTPQWLTQQIEENGPKSVITNLYKNDETQWDYVTNKIGTGEPGWLNIAVLLAPGSDADSAESLATAAATAIPHNPSGVLSILDENSVPLNTAQVCSLPFYDITRTNYNQYVVDAIQALYKVPNSKYCLDTIVNTIGLSNGFVEDN